MIGQMVLPPDHVEETDLCEEYQGEWYRIEDDGTRSLIEMPGRYEKGTAILETTIPENLDGRISHLCFRGTGSLHLFGWKTDLSVFDRGKKMVWADKSGMLSYDTGQGGGCRESSAAGTGI